MKRYFGLVKQESPPTNRPYRLIETNTTSDGIRSRLCDGTYQTLEEAQFALKKKEELE